MSIVLPDAADRAAALDLSRHALVMAPAGSGKTGLLVHRVLRALAVVDVPEQVVAITFTNNAAAEIRARVLDVLDIRSFLERRIDQDLRIATLVIGDFEEIGAPDLHTVTRPAAGQLLHERRIDLVRQDLSINA